jgi:hypothetical protein
VPPWLLTLYEVTGVLQPEAADALSALTTLTTTHINKSTSDTGPALLARLNAGPVA